VNTVGIAVSPDAFVFYVCCAWTQAVSYLYLLSAFMFVCVQRQRQANHQSMDDEVMFITEGLKESSATVLESALFHSLRLFSSQREQMLEVESNRLCYISTLQILCLFHEHVL
jgi:hypothetical protein